MGLLNFFRRKALSASPAVVEALQDRRINPYPALGGTNQRVASAYARGIDGSYGWIYSTQPAVRSVIDFIARNFAQLGLKLYERVGDEERQRREDHAAAELMRDPDGQTPADAFIYRLVSDYLVYDNGYAIKLRSNGDGRMFLLRIPPELVQVAGGRFFATDYIIYRYDGSSFRVPPEALVHWYGYDPSDPLMGLSKLETLRQELATDRATQAALVEVAKNGLRSGYIERPLDAPPWDAQDAERFAEFWRQQKVRADGADPILEEGMKYVVPEGLSAKDAEIIPARQFTKAEVASLYGVPLAAMGAEGSMAESRKLVYSDVLPPYTGRLAEQLDKDLLQAEFSEPDYYFKFDLDEKLRGDVEGRAAAQTATVGRPWRTVNEVRATENLPPLEGGDDLTIPLNVMLAGPDSPALPAPNVMPPQNAIGAPQDGSHREEALEPARKQLVRSTQPRRRQDFNRQQRYIDEALGLFQAFYADQYSAQKSWGKANGWTDELAKRLRTYLGNIVDREGVIYVSRLGGDDFDMRMVRNYLRAMADGAARSIDRVTREDVVEVGAEGAFERARNVRAPVAAARVGTHATVFARQEAAKQAPETDRRVQTWIANTERHSALDGTSVPLGSDWGGIEPGSEPGCACSMMVT